MTFEIKEELEKISDAPDKYRDAFQYLTQIFKLASKDIIIIVYILISWKRKDILQTFQKFADNIYHEPENISRWVIFSSKDHDWDNTHIGDNLK